MSVQVQQQKKSVASFLVPLYRLSLNAFRVWTLFLCERYLCFKATSDAIKIDALVLSFLISTNNKSTTMWNGTIMLCFLFVRHFLCTPAQHRCCAGAQHFLDGICANEFFMSDFPMFFRQIHHKPQINIILNWQNK